MPRFLLILMVLFIVGVSDAFAQPDYQIRGIVSGLNDSTLAGAHLINMNLVTGTISDDSGHFVLAVRPGDSVFVSHIGFFPRIVTLNSDQQKNNLKVYLVPQTTELEGVTIYALPSDFLSFKREFINIKLPPDELTTFHIPAPGPVGVSSEGFGITFSGPVQALYDAFSKEARQKKMLKRLLATDRLDKIRNSRINHQTIKMLTGITDAETIERFMKFCQIDDSRILASNDYELYLSILDCYRLFCVNSD